MRWDVIGLVLGWTIRVVSLPLAVVGIFSFICGRRKTMQLKHTLIPLVTSSY